MPRLLLFNPGFGEDDSASCFFYRQAPPPTRVTDFGFQFWFFGVCSWEICCGFWLRIWCGFWCGFADFWCRFWCGFFQLGVRILSEHEERGSLRPFSPPQEGVSDPFSRLSVSHRCRDALHSVAHTMSQQIPASLEMSQRCRATPLQPSLKDPVARVLPSPCQCRGEFPCKNGSRYTGCSTYTHTNRATQQGCQCSTYTHTNRATQQGCQTQLLIASFSLPPLHCLFGVLWVPSLKHPKLEKTKKNNPQGENPVTEIFRPIVFRARKRHINFEHINFLKVGTTLGQPTG